MTGDVIVTIFLVSIFLISGVQGDSNITSPSIMPVSMSMGAVASNGTSTEQNAASPRSFASSDTSSLQIMASSIPGIEWQDLLGGLDGETLSGIRQTPDGGYIACGFVGSLAGDGDVTSTHGGGDVWIIKFDSAGNIQWQRSLGGSGYDQAISIQLTSDGGYVFAGFTKSSNNGDVGQNNGGYDAWIVKLDSNGNIQWQKVLGGSADDLAFSIRQTSDGGYIFSGVTGATFNDELNIASHPFMGGHAWVVKLDSTGSVTWQKVYGGNSDDEANSIVQTSDGGYIFVGTTYSNNSGDVGANHGLTDIWVVKLDSTGTIQWTKLLGGAGWDITSLWWDNGIQQTSDGGYVIIGTTTSTDFGGQIGINHGAGDVCIIKLDNNGNIIWERPYGGSNADNGISINQTPDGGYVFTGFTYSDNSGDVGASYGNGDYWVGKTDSNGNLQWQIPLGGSAYDQAESIQSTSDGGYIVTGRSYSSNSGVVAEQNHGNIDAWVVKLTPRFVVNVMDSDTGGFIPGSNVGLYDSKYDVWMNQTVGDGPVVFNGSVGLNAFNFTDDRVFGLSVSAGGYPSASENVKFEITNQTVNVYLTSFDRPAIGQTYSMTMIQNPGPLGGVSSLIVDGFGWGTAVHGVVQNWLETQEGWSNTFYHTEDQVTQVDFGTNYQGLDNATFFYHFGHGHLLFLMEGSELITTDTYIPLSGWSAFYPTPSTSVKPSDVYKKWGGQNKWVFLDACSLLTDKRWGGALNTSHGILGYQSSKYVSTDLPNAFFYNAFVRNESIVQSYYEATIASQAGYAPAVIFATPDQFYHDHMPGHGTIAADESPDNNITYYVSWCAQGVCGQ
ncbi:autotransporter outer membrane beta-barrel domain-containing protein [Methanoregula boonei]|jgi:hypothetical protein|nr:hypothetical protein [Methanoregula boonei]